MFITLTLFCLKEILNTNINNFYQLVYLECDYLHYFVEYMIGYNGEIIIEEI